MEETSSATLQNTLVVEGLDSEVVVAEEIFVVEDGMLSFTPLKVPLTSIWASCRIILRITTSYSQSVLIANVHGVNDQWPDNIGIGEHAGCACYLWRPHAVFLGC